MQEKKESASRCGGVDLSKPVNVDIVLCFDLTGAMSGFGFEARRLNSLLYPALMERAREREVELGEVRVCPIFFKDYNFDSDPMFVFPYFALPEEEDDLGAVIDDMFSNNVGGGGDLRESAFEALYFALRRFERDNFPSNCRRVIGIYSDGDARLPEDADRDFVCGYYPEDMPCDTESYYGEFSSEEPSVNICGFMPEYPSPYNGAMDALRGIPGAVIRVSNAAGLCDIEADAVIEDILSAVFDR
jgi:hypothetical protein